MSSPSVEGRRRVGIGGRARGAAAARRRRAVVAGALVAMVGWLAGCDRESDEPANDTVAVLDPAVVESTVVAESTAVAAAAVANGWPLEDAGRWLFVPGAGSVLSAQLVFPQYSDSTLTAATRFAVDGIGEQRVELFAPAGRVGGARLLAPELTAPPGCTGWPQARVLADDEPVGPWTVAFAEGLAQAIPLDSIAGLARADSAQLAAGLARLASTLPEDTASVFRGLPFVVRSARRFTPVPGVQAVVADVVRRVNTEATPLAEHLLLVAERPADAPTARWTSVYVERVRGQEETLEITDVLAAVTLGAERRPTLVIGRDYGDGTAFSLVERVDGRRWRLRWSSAYAGC